MPVALLLAAVIATAADPATADPAAVAGAADPAIAAARHATSPSPAILDPRSLLAPRRAPAPALYLESPDDPTAPDDPRDEAPAKGAPRAPAIGAVISAAYRAAGLDHDPGGGWITRARIAGLIPWVTVRGARDTSWQDAQPDIGHSQTIEVRATWRLDRLLFDGRELHVAGIQAARYRERRRLATRVIRAYFTWRRATSAAGNPGGPLRVEEATAELDALTNGWFSAALTSAARTVSSNGP